uniref:Uncharacterized protein n=1 Tax=Anguilla anguilla TaxID=7936 RepID=A0A0E9THV7_ANGAN
MGIPDLIYILVLNWSFPTWVSGLKPDKPSQA